MEKLSCTICDFCRIIIFYRGCKPLRDYIETKDKKHYCSKKCKSKDARKEKSDD